MVLTDKMLNDVTSDYAADSFYLAFSTGTDLSPGTGDTALDGEVGTRVSCTVTVLDNQVTVSGTRSAAYVTDTVVGDKLTAIGVFDSLSGGVLHSVTGIATLTHTINFDLDVDIPILFERS